MSLDINSYLNLFDAVVILAVSLPTLYIGTRIKTKTIKVLFALLSGFLVLHGLFHFTYFLGDFLNSDAISFGDGLIEPLSYVLLFTFAVYYAKRGGGA